MYSVLIELCIPSSLLDSLPAWLVSNCALNRAHLTCALFQSALLYSVSCLCEVYFLPLTTPDSQKP